MVSGHSKLLDTFKRALRKAEGGETKEELLQFFRFYRITPNPRTTSGLPNKNQKFTKIMQIQQNFSSPAKKIYFKENKNGKVGWKEGLIEKRIGRLEYIIKHPKWIVKRHYNHLKKRYTIEPNYHREEPIKVIYDLFGILRLQVAPKQKRSSKRKRQSSLILDIDSKRKRYDFRGSEISKEGDVVEY